VYCSFRGILLVAQYRCQHDMNVFAIAGPFSRKLLFVEAEALITLQGSRDGSHITL